MIRIKIVLIVQLLLLATCSIAQYRTSVERIHSSFVRDSFDIYISIPADSFKGQFDKVIYYLDANLKSGKSLRKLVEDDKVQFKKKFLYVGIAHIGNHHPLRQRDFILPFIRNGDTVPRSPEYGQIDRFYRFLQSELIPSIDKRFPSAGRRSIVGHSLGGLFTVYCLFRNEGLFNSYFALSPSLWIDDYSIFSFNRIADSLANPSYFFLSAGLKEKFNNILKGFHRMVAFIDEKKYHGLGFFWHLFPGTHNSYIKKHMQTILYKYVLQR